MFDQSLREEVEKTVDVLEEKRAALEYHGIAFPTDDYDLVLDVVETKDKMTIRQYYFVDHNTKTLFWLDNYDMKPLLNVPGVEEPGHVSE